MHMLGFASTSASSAPPRNIYLDFGANWGDTLDAYQRLANPRDIAPNAEWEIFAFEASPYVQPFLDDEVRWRNGDSSTRPIPCVPPLGSSEDLAYLIPDVFDEKNITCHRRYFPKATSCVRKVFLAAYNALTPNLTLLSEPLVEARRAEASPAQASRRRRIGAPRFTLVPAAVGVRNGQLPADSISTFMVNPKSRLHETSLKNLTIQVVDVAQWLRANFREVDYVVAKV